MKGDIKTIKNLNSLLSDELAGINQHIVHSEMCEYWGYERLHDGYKRMAVDEMKHSGRLIKHILSLEGAPVVNKPSDIFIGADIEQQLYYCFSGVLIAIKNYNSAIHEVLIRGDYETAEILKEILLEEARHLDWLETQMEKIRQLSMSSYLLEQIAV